MKKSMILLGMLSIGYANAQTGRVGINNASPSATLNVKTKDDAQSPKNLELENQAGDKLVTVLNTGKVGIGTDTPIYKLELIAKDSSYRENSLAFRAFREDDGSSSIDVFRARGTVDAPKAVKKGDYLASWGAVPYDGTTYFSTAYIQTVVTGDVVEGRIPTSIIFTMRDPMDKSTPEKENDKPAVAMIHHSGNVGIGTIQPTQKLDVAGNIKASSFINSSDARLKKDIINISNATATINNLRAVNYYWNNEEQSKGMDSKLQYGFIAQEVEKVLPSLVNTDEKGYKSVNYIGIIPVLVKSLQEKEEKIKELETRLEKLEKMLNN